MFKILLLILQGLWPYVKDALLKDGSARDWFRRNITEVLWFGALLIMFGSVLWLVDLTTSVSTQNTSLRNDLHEEKVRGSALEAKYSAQLQRVSELETQVADLNARLELKAAEHGRFTTWVDHCQVDYDPETLACPTKQRGTIVRRVSSPSNTAYPSVNRILNHAK